MMSLSKQGLEQSRRLSRERLKLDDKTDNEVWYLRIHLRYKDGILYRQGYIEKQTVGRLYQVYARWDYGVRDDNSDIAFSKNIPAYVKERCIDLGIRMGTTTPLTGIDHRDPDYTYPVDWS